MGFSSSGRGEFGCPRTLLQAAENGACTEKNLEYNMRWEKQKEDYNTVSLWSLEILCQSQEKSWDWLRKNIRLFKSDTFGLFLLNFWFLSLLVHILDYFHSKTTMARNVCVLLMVVFPFHFDFPINQYIQGAGLKNKTQSGRLLIKSWELVKVFISSRENNFRKVLSHGVGCSPLSCVL